ncbi:MAG: hypothetical protein VYA30_10050 [Myxococcota bacterium]|nr:hypothetical protein [Myxococcota bacterium]
MVRKIVLNARFGPLCHEEYGVGRGLLESKMLDAFIIDEILRRQMERENEDERPAIQIPVPEPEEVPEDIGDVESPSVIIIDI